MKLTRILKVTEKDFYDFLEKDLLSNIYQCTGKELSEKDIKKGLIYSKFDNDALTRIDVCILDYKRGSFFKSQIKSVIDTITISFETETADDGLKVIFNQHIQSFENQKHSKFMKLFSEAVYYGRMSNTLYDIQKKIVNSSK
ncbi:DUF3284 domain-containing protein [Clostridium sp. SYSU_GA19001]|uniref:DUF3284 domain-containing protein n=1 Tax=Clostridium caldaquaticum TaxID=2940653 RepID=UPI00207751B6|nr:DUF3284 domain-containing protein [Clostridium caldaquaticum]MCM8711887.1 DUF3284 domain-containing protein [Clostridium caldaquaticum]